MRHNVVSAEPDDQRIETREGNRIESKVALERVAFYEIGAADGKGIVRCHGESLIQEALSYVSVS